MSEVRDRPTGYLKSAKRLLWLRIRLCASTG